MFSLSLCFLFKPLDILTDFSILHEDFKGYHNAGETCYCDQSQLKQLPACFPISWLLLFYELHITGHRKNHGQPIKF